MGLVQRLQFHTGPGRQKHSEIMVTAKPIHSIHIFVGAHQSAIAGKEIYIVKNEWPAPDGNGKARPLCYIGRMECDLPYIDSASILPTPLQIII